MGKYGTLRKKIKKEMIKSILFYQNCVKCERCGHSINLGGEDKRICEFCGLYVFKDKKTEFKYRLKERGIK